MPQRNSVTWTIYLSDGTDTLVEISTIDPPISLEPLSIVESVGAERLDTAQFEVVGASVVAINPYAYIGKQIAVVNDVTSEVVHWGRISNVIPSIQSSGEVVTIVSRTELFNLGARVDGYYVWDPLAASGAGAAVLIDGDLIFNPLIDGQIYGNHNDTRVGPNGEPLILDPESVRTAAAITLQGADAQLFTLSRAVDYLLAWLNPAETHITNTASGTLDTIFGDPTALVQNVFIPRGIWLAQALDMLLEPLGYSWRAKRIAYNAREYSFWKHGTGGAAVNVYLQAAGATLSDPRVLTQTNMETAGIAMNAAALANEITVRGGLKEYEVTVELLRSWPEAQDALCTDIDALTMNVIDGVTKTFEDWLLVQDVFRKWVLNEAGDYIGVRVGFPAETGPLTQEFRLALDDAGILDQFIARRREMLPTLTLGPDGLNPIGTVRGVEVEYARTIGEDTPVWLPIQQGDACTLLEREAGILFAGERIPEHLLDNPDTGEIVRVRATFTLQSDYRVSSTAIRQADSPQPDVVSLVLDIPDRFRWRSRTDGAGFLSKYSGTAEPSLAVDDFDALESFGLFVRDVSDRLDVGGAIQIEGLDSPYTLGDRLQAISGKGISFEMRDSTDYYPHIVAIERQVSDQRMILHIQRQTEAIPLPAPTKGNQARFAPRSVSRGRHAL